MESEAENEITLSPGTGLSLLLAVVLALGLVLGIIFTPRTQGRPVILSRENLALKAYLDRAGGWVWEMEEVGRSMLGALSGNSAHPSSIYEQARIARGASERLRNLEAQVERARVPAALGGLDRLVREAVGRHLRACDLVLDYVGAPEERKLAAVREALDSAKGSLPPVREALEGARK